MLQTSEILLDEEPESANAEFKFEFIDLFAGIGGLRCPSSYKMGHESVLSIGGSGSFV